MCMSKPSIPPAPPPPPPPPPPPVKMNDRLRPSAALAARASGSGTSGYDNLVIPMRGTGVNVPGA